MPKHQQLQAQISPDTTCLQCGETYAAVRQEKLDCAIIDHYFGEVSYEWNRHRWKEWSDKELAYILPEYRDLYRRDSDMGVYAPCEHKGLDHTFLEDDPHVPPNRCICCWTSKEEQ